MRILLPVALAAALSPAAAAAQQAATPAAPRPAPTLPAPASSGPGAAPGAPKLPQDEVLRRALATSASLRGARARREVALGRAHSVRGLLLPGVAVSYEAQRWDSPYLVGFPIGPDPSHLTMVPFPARDQDTSALAVTAGQPLLGLLHIGSDVAAASSASDAAAADARTAEADVKQQVLAQLLRLFEARALKEIASASVAQLDDQLQVARARLQSGVLTRADVLRIETAAANARQQQIQADAQEVSERAGLLVAIGESPDTRDVDFADPVLPEPTPAPELDAALRGALARRSEVESARLVEEAAQRSARARTFDLLPEVSAEGAWLRITGQPFSPETSWFIGLRADWAVWDWGAKWFARSAAAAQADAAAAQQAGVRDQVSVEVAARLAGTRAAANAVEAARTGIVSAEEAYRVTDALVQAGSATTTDLLDAQAALTTARSNLARARYAYALTRVDLARATGEL